MYEILCASCYQLRMLAETTERDNQVGTPVLLEPWAW